MTITAEVSKTNVRKRQRTKVKADPVTLILVAIVCIFLFFLVGLPLLKVLSTALSADGMDALGKMFTSKSNLVIIMNTLVLGLTVASVGTIVGFLMAFVQVKVRCRGKKVMHLLSLLPIVSPPFAVATASITLFGSRGIISHQLLGQNWHIYGLPGLTLVLSLSFFPVAYQNLAGMLRSLDPATEEASASLGGNAWTVFRTVTFPMLIRGVFLVTFRGRHRGFGQPIGYRWRLHCFSFTGIHCGERRVQHRRRRGFLSASVGAGLVGLYRAALLE